jgi:hypothetical protein
VQLLALAFHARHLSQDAVTAQINSAIGPESVTQPTVGKWLREKLPEISDPTIAVRRPDDLQLRFVCLFFRRDPARALKLVKLLAAEPHVSRIEQWRGEFNVFAEVVVSDSRAVDDLVERYEPEALHEMVERIERLPQVLEHVARQAIVARH